MQEPKNESKPKQALKPGRWVFRATIAMLFIAVGITGIRAYRFYAAVDAVERFHGRILVAKRSNWLESSGLHLGRVELFFAKEIAVLLTDTSLSASPTSIIAIPVSPLEDDGLRGLTPHLHEFDKLRYLSFRGANISDEGLSYVSHFNQLIFLDLSRTKISDAGLQYLVGFENLNDLILDNCNVTDEGIRHLESLKGLETLSLDGTDITDEGLKHLRSLKNLKELSLSNTGVTDEGCAELLKSIPDLEILDD